MNWQLASVAGFSLLVFVVGVAAARRHGRSRDVDSLLIGNRNLPLWLGIVTMTATWVGGGFINGTAEIVYDADSGIVWAQAPWGYALSLVIGGLFFARPLYERGCRTLLDPFEQSYGPKVAALLSIPAVFGEICWSAAILVALGTSGATILGWDIKTAIVVSSSLAVAYTVIGGLWSVAVTDAVQLLLILVGLLIALPFVLESAGGATNVFETYFSSTNPMPEGEGLVLWSDFALLLIFGGIPWQVYFQRVLASRNADSAVRLSVVAGIGCVLLALPAVVIGMAASTYDWSLNPAGAPESNAVVLPWTLQYLTPPIVATLGLAAIMAAVMSSVDSSILSAASLAVCNVYQPLFQRSTDSRESTLAVRVFVVLSGITAAALALSVQSVYGLWAFCSDFVYVILFPQLVVVLFVPFANRRGAICGIFVSLFLRALAGEPLIGLPAYVDYPGWYPVRTAAMLSGLLTIIAVSRLCPDDSARPQSTAV